MPNPAINLLRDMMDSPLFGRNANFTAITEGLSLTKISQASPPDYLKLMLSLKIPGNKLLTAIQWVTSSRAARFRNASGVIADQFIKNEDVKERGNILLTGSDFIQRATPLMALAKYTSNNPRFTNLLSPIQDIITAYGDAYDKIMVGASKSIFPILMKNVFESDFDTVADQTNKDTEAILTAVKAVVTPGAAGTVQPGTPGTGTSEPASRRTMPDILKVWHGAWESGAESGRNHLLSKGSEFATEEGWVDVMGYDVEFLWEDLGRIVRNPINRYMLDATAEDIQKLASLLVVLVYMLRNSKNKSDNINVRNYYKEIQITLDSISPLKSNWRNLSWFQKNAPHITGKTSMSISPAMAAEVAKILSDEFSKKIINAIDTGRNSTSFTMRRKLDKVKATIGANGMNNIQQLQNDLGNFNTSGELWAARSIMELVNKSGMSDPNFIASTAILELAKKGQFYANKLKPFEGYADNPDVEAEGYKEPQFTSQPNTWLNEMIILAAAHLVDGYSKIGSKAKNVESIIGLGEMDFA